MVYRATSRALARQVAVKVVLKARLSKAGRDNLVTEIGLLKRLQHRFIVELVDFHWDDRNIYIVTEFCPGGDLSAAIKARRKLAEAQVAPLAQQLGAALRYLRQHRVSHLDLKPSNLLLSSTAPPLLKVADFGLAQHLAGEAREVGLRGSPLYMAPEVLLADSYGPKADLWSVGVILYEALYGRAPFAAATLEEVVARVKEEGVVEVPPRAPALSPPCTDLIRRCLVRNPEKRIDFGDFFDHPFLDLEHLPDEESLGKAGELAAAAVAAEEGGERRRAAELYTAALRFLRPLVYYELDRRRRERLEARVAGYAARLRQLRRPEEVEGGEEEELVALCSSSPTLVTGVEVCRAGEHYLAEGEAVQGLERVTAGLGALVPALRQEPRGRRRALLAQAVARWLAMAEAAKAQVAEGEEVEVGVGEKVGEAKGCSIT